MNGQRRGGVYAYNGVLLARKRYYVIYRKVSVTGDHHIKQNKSDSKDSNQVDNQD